MEETFLEKTIHALVFFGICAGIVFLGWREPLRYRFLSTEQIAEIERSISPANQQSPQPDWAPMTQTVNRLNEQPRYRSGGRGEIYSLPHRKADGLNPPPERAHYYVR